MTQSKGEEKRTRRRWSGLKQLKTATRSELFFSVVLSFRFPRRFVPFRRVCLSLAMDDVKDEVVDVLRIPFVDLEVFWSEVFSTVVSMRLPPDPTLNSFPAVPKTKDVPPSSFKRGKGPSFRPRRTTEDDDEFPDADG